MKNKALLVIDMQKGSFEPKSIRYNAGDVINNINELSNLFREFHYPVIIIQHDGTGSGEFEKYDSDWEVLDELCVNDKDYLVDKYANDVFYKSNLDELLKVLKIKDVWVTGCATDFCVEATVQSALSKDYNVNVIEDGHTTENREHLDAKTIVIHYNWVWQNMLPTKGEIKVLDTNQAKKELRKECVRDGK